MLAYDCPAVELFVSCPPTVIASNISPVWDVSQKTINTCQSSYIKIIMILTAKKYIILSNKNSFVNIKLYNVA